MGRLIFIKRLKIVRLNGEFLELGLYFRYQQT